MNMQQLIPQLTANALEFCVGLHTKENTPVLLSIEKETSLLIHGWRQTDTLHSLQNLLVQIYARNTPDLLQVTFVNPLPQTVQPFLEQPQTRVVDIAECSQLLEQARGPNRTMPPRVLIVVDQMETVAPKSTGFTALSRILAAGRPYGLRVVALGDLFSQFTLPAPFGGGIQTWRKGEKLRVFSVWTQRPTWVFPLPLLEQEEIPLLLVDSGKLPE